MAIYSLNHKAIGKATQDRPYTAAAHVRYITRSDACRTVLGERIPLDPKNAQGWFRSEERADRKNARVCDKVMIALPRELDADQREALVSDFASRVTKGQAPWMAAIHDKGKDRKNPHCHLVMRDRDESGRRCLHMSAGKAERALLKERGIDAMTTDRMRDIWEKAANDHLERSE
ncbi:MobA/MobL family protein, partial [Pseudosulfitobacter sp. DSM 107133]|uniref:MobA/MobL family protein n=1 Tax=Pseudosulfitobacter sp. DSM 107133 TaxID=2883100 RepID=UPI0019667F7D